MTISFFNRPRKDIVAALAFLSVSVLLVWAAVWAYNKFITSPPYVDPDTYPVRGIDISSHNGNVDMKKVAGDGFRFVFIKATEGESFVDKKFRTNFENARKAGLKIGAYHFFRFERDGVNQAINLLKTLGARKPDLGIVVDVEQAGNNPEIPTDSVTSRLTQMVDYLNLMGHRVMFYTNKDGYFKYIADTFPGSPLWICSFSSNPINAEWTFWQFNHRGKVNGVKGDVDLNTFCGSEEEWQNFLHGSLWPYDNPD